MFYGLLSLQGPFPKLPPWPWGGGPGLLSTPKARGRMSATCHLPRYSLYAGKRDFIMREARESWVHRRYRSLSRVASRGIAVSAPRGHYCTHFTDELN